MKKITLVLLLAFLTINYNLFSQSQKEEIKNTEILQSSFNKDANAFFKLFNEENWKGMTEMMYPKLFDLAPKDQMISALVQMSENGLKITVNEVKIYKISSPILSKGEVFRKLSYKAKMKIKLSGDMLESIELIEENFKDIYGEKNVILDKKRNVFLISSDKSLIAITEKGQSNWKYLEFNESKPQMLKAIFPNAVYQEFKSK